jgi:hypothetical protein
MNMILFISFTLHISITIRVRVQTMASECITLDLYSHKNMFHFFFLLYVGPMELMFRNKCRLLIRY